MRTRTLATLATLPLALAVAGVASPAAAVGPGSDTTPPKVSLQPQATFIEGTELTTYYWDGYMEDWQVPLRFDWSASDAGSGICSQRITEKAYAWMDDTGSADPVLGHDTVTWTVPSTKRQDRIDLDFWGWFRLGVHRVVRVTDCAGNTATSGVASASVRVAEDDDSALAYTGAWRRSAVPGASDGAVRTSTRSGDSVSTVVETGKVALVVERGPGRGELDVLVDGVRRRTVDTGAAEVSHRRVVWQTRLSPGRHTVTVVNKGTQGRPRVDLDVVLS